MSDAPISRQIAILVDGAYFLRRLPRLGLADYIDDPSATTHALRRLCRRHVQILTNDHDRFWQRHVYRIFFYDALPYEGAAHHPLRNRIEDYGKSNLAQARRALFERLKRERNVALRLGKVIRHDDWTMPTRKLKPLLATRDFLAGLDLAAVPEDGSVQLTPDQLATARRLQQRWSDLADGDVALDLRQKGVDMRIGLDIAALAFKRLVNTIVLVSGDSDFVPAAKLARREGMQFILDPLWQTVNEDLFEHIDGLQSGFPKPNTPAQAGAIHVQKDGANE